MKTEFSLIEKKEGSAFPLVKFLDDVERIIQENGFETVLEEMRGVFQKLKFTENQFHKFKESMLFKIPEIEKAIELIKFQEEDQKSEEEQIIKFSLNDCMFKEAKISQKGIVYLWLGANTIVQYSFSEALELLSKNLVNARTNLDTYIEDLGNIRDQITIMEVNLARVYNYKNSQESAKR